MRRQTTLYALAGLSVAAGVVLAFVVGPVRVCVEFSGCSEDPTAQYAFVLAGLMFGVLFLTVAAARRDRWKRDARYWNDQT